MPTVPGIDQTPSLSQNVPGVAFPMRGASEAGEMISRGGKGVEAFGQDIGVISDEIQRQQDVSTAALATTKSEISLRGISQNVADQSTDGFMHDDDGSISTNKDGSQRTILQEGWDQMNTHYQDAQQGMTPRAAAIYRSATLRAVGENAQRLQGQQLVLQSQAAKNSVGAMLDVASKDFDQSFVPKDNAYYTTQQTDGSTKEYPSAQKLFDAIDQSRLTIQRLGPQGDKPGAYAASEVQPAQQDAASKLAENWLTSAKLDLIESQGSRAALHQSMKDASSTAVMQAHSLLDIVEGKDQQSQRRNSVGAPTVNSSLTPAQVEKWRSDILGMIPAAKEVDKSEYELQKQQLGETAKGVKNLDQLFNSALMQKTVMMGSGLGMTSAERVKDFAPIVSDGVVAAALSSTTPINSPEAKRQAATAVLQDAAKRWPVFAQQIGEKDVSGFGNAIATAASKQVAEKLAEDERKMRENPLGYAAAIRPGPQGPGGTPQYGDKTQHALEGKLDPRSGDPSLTAIFKPMSPGGKSVLQTAQESANNIYSRMFNSKADVSALQPEQFKDQARRIVSSNDPHLITTYFSKLEQSGLSDKQKEAFQQDLVDKGGLPQTYVDALNNLKTPAEREARWATLQAGAPALPEGVSHQTLEQLNQQDNKNLYKFLDTKYGPNSPAARTARDTYGKAYKDDIVEGLNRGMGESQARAYAQGLRDKTTGAIGIVGAEHSLWGIGLGRYGPQVPVEFGSNKYTPEQQQHITDTLLHFQDSKTLSQYKFVPAPGALPKNDNAPSDADNVAANVSMWRKVPGGWRLQQKELDKENRPTGNSTDVQIYVSDGKTKTAHFLEVHEQDALAGPPQGAAHSVSPAPKATNNPGAAFGGGRHPDSIGGTIGEMFGDQRSKADQDRQQEQRMALNPAAVPITQRDKSAAYDKQLDHLTGGAHPRGALVNPTGPGLSRPLYEK